MPVNAGPEYFIAEKKYSEAKTKRQKIAALEDMIRTAPKHKSSEKLVADLRKRLAKLKKEKSVQAKPKPNFSIRKEGSAQVCIVGHTNSGKSSLLKSLTNTKVEIGSYEYTTSKPAVGMMDYSGVKIQMIEIPSTFVPESLAIVRTCDLILVLLDGTKDLEDQLDKIIDILEDNKIIDKSLLIVSNKCDEIDNYPVLQVSAKKGNNIKQLKDFIWSRLGLIRIYTKSPGRPKAQTPLTLHKGSTVRDVTNEVHKTMLKNFRFARIFNSTKYSGRKVGLDYILSDLDIVEIHAG